MSDELRSQLAEYGQYHREAQAPVDLDEIAALGDRVRPIPAGRPSPRRWRRGVAVAVAAAALLLVLVGVVPFLRDVDRATPPAATVVPTTVAPTSVPPTTAPDVEDTTPATTTVPIIENEQPEADLGSITLPLIAEVVTPSSIGDVTWRIFESAGEGESFEVMAGLGAAASGAPGIDQDLDPSLEQDDVLIVEGPIAVNAYPTPVVSVGSARLTEWSFGFDPIATTMLTAGGDLPERSADGRLLGLGDVTGDTIEVALYDNERDADLSTHKPAAVESEPAAIIARYGLDTTLGEDGTVLRVIDADTGQLLGSVTAAITLDSDPSIYWGFPLVRQGEYYVSVADTAERLITLSDDGSIEQVRPEWAGGNLDAYVRIGERILAYVEPSPFAGFQIWQTVDGRDWTNLGRPNGWPSGYAQPQITRDDGMLVVDLNDQIGGRPDNILLTSSNGIDWAPVETLPPGNGRLVGVDDGFAWVDGEEVELWTSPDAMTWEMVDLSDIPLPRGGLLGGGSSGNVVWFHQAEEVDRLWVLEFTSNE